MSTLPESGTTAPTFTLSDNETQPHWFPSAGGAVAELLFFVKHDCATCAMVSPIVEQLHQLMAAAGFGSSGSLRAILTRRPPSSSGATPPFQRCLTRSSMCPAATALMPYPRWF